MGERSGPVVGGSAPVLVEEQPAEVRTAQAFEVHGQEGHVRQHVPVPQPVVDLEAVQDPGTVVETEDVVGQEVAVPVASPALGDAPVEGLAAGEVAARQTHHLGRHLLVEGVADEPLHLRRVGLPERRMGVATGGLVDRR